MRLYLFELEKIMKKPLHFAAVSGCAVFTFVLWWMYADQADYSMGEGAAAALLLLGVHGLFAYSAFATQTNAPDRAVR